MFVTLGGVCKFYRLMNTLRGEHMWYLARSLQILLLHGLIEERRMEKNPLWCGLY